MGADGTERIQVHAAPPPEAAVLALVELVRKERPAFLVADPLFRLASIRDEKAYAEVYGALGLLIDVARETGTHIMLLHHSGKSRKSDAIDSPLGSSALGGVPATLIVLNRRDSSRTIQTVTRIGPTMPETILAFDKETHLLSVGATKEEADREQVEAGIVDYLDGREAGKPESEIVDHIEGRHAVKRKALRNLVDRALVSRTGTGKKGDPFIYSFPRTDYAAGTTVRGAQNGAASPANVEEMLVPENEKLSLLVPENSDAEKGPSSDAKNGQQTIRSRSRWNRRRHSRTGISWRQPTPLTQGRRNKLTLSSRTSSKPRPPATRRWASVPKTRKKGCFYNTIGTHRSCRSALRAAIERELLAIDQRSASFENCGSTETPSSSCSGDDCWSHSSCGGTLSVFAPFDGSPCSVNGRASAARLSPAAVTSIECSIERTS
jgi:hypothetical protein